MYFLFRLAIYRNIRNILDMGELELATQQLDDAVP